MNTSLKYLLTFLTLGVISIHSLGQDRILTMSGREIECKIIDDTQIEFIFEVTKKSDKKFTKRIHVSTIYSYTKGDQTYQIYEKDIELGNWMSEEEMLVYIQGEQDARANYNTKLVKVVGVASGFALTYISQGSFIVPIIAPFAWAACQFIPVIKIKEKYMTDTGYSNNDFYLRGFEPVARTKRVLDALKTGFIGSGLGVIFYIILPQD